MALSCRRLYSSGVSATGQAVLAQKVHQQAHFALLGELTADLLRLAVGDAARAPTAAPARCIRMSNVSSPNFSAMRAAEPRTDAANQARTEVLRDAAHRGRQPALKRLGRKLLAVGRVRRPSSRSE